MNKTKLLIVFKQQYPFVLCRVFAARNTLVLVRDTAALGKLSSAISVGIVLFFMTLLLPRTS
jgi:hypothetical protein